MLHDIQTLNFKILKTCWIFMSYVVICLTKEQISHSIKAAWQESPGSQIWHSLSTSLMGVDFLNMMQYSAHRLCSAQHWKHLWDTVVGGASFYYSSKPGSKYAEGKPAWRNRGAFSILNSHIDQAMKLCAVQGLLSIWLTTEKLGKELFYVTNKIIWGNGI